MNLPSNANPRPPHTPAQEPAQVSGQPTPFGPLGLSWPLLVVLLCTVLPLALLSFPTLEDPDTAMHLAIGEWIFQHGRIPTTDPFSYTVLGQPWIAHEWLAECVMALFNRLAGWSGLALMTLLCLGATLAYLLRFMLKRMPPIYALLFTALASAPLATHLLARPHVLTWPLLALWLGRLVQASEEQRAPPMWLAGLMVLWANLHGSFTLGLALVPAMALDALFTCAPGRRWAVLRQWLPFAALTLLAAMATPSGWRGIWFTFHLIDLKYLHYISEWQPASGLNFWPLELWVVALLGLAALGLLRLPPWRLLLIAGLLHQAFSAGRYISIFGLLAPLWLATAFGQHYQGLQALQARRETGALRQASALDGFFERLAHPARPLTLALALAGIGLAAWATSHWRGSAVRPGASIVPALQAAQAAGAQGRVFNTYNFGGRLIAQGTPVFIDGRADLYGNAHMGRYFEIIETNDAQVIRQALDEFGIGWTLLHPRSGMLLYLNSQPDWHKVYEDKDAVVHLRRNAPSVRP